MCFWTGWVITYALLIATPLSIYTDRERLDEVGKLVRVRRPLIGFKRCKVALDVDGINNGLNYAVNGNTDLRLHDGCRYGYASIRT